MSNLQAGQGIITKDLKNSSGDESEQLQVEELHVSQLGGSVEISITVLYAGKDEKNSESCTRNPGGRDKRRTKSLGSKKFEKERAGIVDRSGSTRQGGGKGSFWSVGE